MTLLTAVAGLALLAVLGYCGYIAVRKDAPVKGSWLLGAGLSMAFLAYSIYLVLPEGILGFWTQSTTSGWGNQIWVDLLIAIGIGWTFVVPRARAQRMQLFPWLLLILASGSVGLLAMVARVLYLEERSTMK